MQEDGDFKRTALSGSEIDQVTVVLPEVSRSLMTIMGNFPFNFCFIDYAKAFDCMDHNKLWKILQEMGIPGHLTCLFRNLYAGQETTVRTGHETTDWFQVGKGVCQGCILSPCSYNLYAEYIMRNAGLEEAQAGIKISRRNINNFRYADDTTLMAESEVAQSCPTLRDPVDCSPPGSSIHGIFQARVLEWGAIAFSSLSPRESQNSCP